MIISIPDLRKNSENIYAFRKKCCSLAVIALQLGDRYLSIHFSFGGAFFVHYIGQGCLIAIYFGRFTSVFLGYDLWHWHSLPSAEE